MYDYAWWKLLFRLGLSLENDHPLQLFPSARQERTTVKQDFSWPVVLIVTVFSPCVATVATRQVKGKIVVCQKSCAPVVGCLEAGDVQFISHRKCLDTDHVAGHDVARLPLLFDPYDKFVFKFWPLTLLSSVAALVLRHAFEPFNCLRQLVQQNQTGNPTRLCKSYNLFQYIIIRSKEKNEIHLRN